jgi:dihydroorotate dehydrogenase electron transfer subunit
VSGVSTSVRRLAGARVASVERPGPGYAIVRVLPDEPFGAAPGQFAMLRVPGGCGAFLHRPMSILDAGPTVDFLVREAGAGSRALARLVPGDRLEMIAPLGTPFPPTGAGAREVLVAGGVGAAPLLFQARRAVAAGGRPLVIYGARSGADLVLAAPMGEAAETVLVTEDGSLGTRGRANDALAAALAGRPDRVLACGPIAMMAETARLSAGASVPCLACLEALMACGFGACLGCAVPAAAGGYLYVCSDGPVVDAALVCWSAIGAA